MRYGLLSTAAFAALSLSVATGMAQTSSSGGAAGGAAGSSSGSMTTSPSGSSAQPQTGAGASGSATTTQRPAGSAAGSATTSGSTTGSVSAAPSLTTEQQTTLRESIGSRVQPVPNVNFSVNTGTVIPADARVELHELPPTLIRTMPAYRTYRYFVVGDQIVIVEPSSRRIVQVVTRAG